MAQEKIKLALVGYGKMGREIEKLAQTKYRDSFDIVSRIDPEIRGAEYKEINGESVGRADVCIDFTRPEAVVDNIKKLVDLKKQIVVGTTGWNDRVEEVKSYIGEVNGGLIYSPNFSLGVNAYLRGMREAAKILALSESFQYSLAETHHTEKRDVSGTAKKMAQALRDAGIPFPDEKIESSRVGNVVGRHLLSIESPFEKMEFYHDAQNRQGFADGTLVASRWIQDKSGFFTIDNMFEEMMDELNEIQ